MKVKTLKPHNNGYGDKFEKTKGYEYSLPDAAAKTLIAANKVSEVKEPEAKTTGKTSDASK